jgi:hypothetical protein
MGKKQRDINNDDLDQIYKRKTKLKNNTRGPSMKNMMGLSPSRIPNDDLV